MSKVLQNAPKEHSAILLTFIKLQFVFKIIVLSSTFIKLPFVFKIVGLSIFAWPFQTGFTVHISAGIGQDLLCVSVQHIAKRRISRHQLRPWYAYTYDVPVQLWTLYHFEQNSSRNIHLTAKAIGALMTKPDWHRLSNTYKARFHRKPTFKTCIKWSACAPVAISP